MKDERGTMAPRPPAGEGPGFADVRMKNYRLPTSLAEREEIHEHAYP